jgi:hypothetical protein
MKPEQLNRLRHLRAIPPDALTTAQLVELGQLEALALQNHEEIIP